MTEKSPATEPGQLVLDRDAFGSPATSRRPGPPNRMNDLVYRDWMKFQKSFFRFVSDQQLVEECIYFFTKARWDDGAVSRTLIAGSEAFSAAEVSEPRVVTHLTGDQSIDQIVYEMRRHVSMRGLYDFAMIDLRRLTRTESDLDRFITEQADNFFRALRESLHDDRYCCIVVCPPQAGGGGFPTPWSVALSARSRLRLRDEKVGIIEKDGSLLYCLFMQANSDGRPSEIIRSNSIRLCDEAFRRAVPAWIIPKSPPRKRNEILHPAKFPEALIQHFIRLYTSESDRVFDPMVGTGSTVIAALRAGRHGYGIDLSDEFVEISRARIAREQTPVLFPSTESTGEVFVGDASNLDRVRELDGLVFDYAVTSPPYWSMLKNPGSENQRSRRVRKLPLVYSNDVRDLGNISDYDEFLKVLISIYSDVADRLVDDGVLTVIVKNIKRDHILYTLAWDLTNGLCGSTGPYQYMGTTLWCQDDVGLKPFAVGIYWVSNILHTYCLHFQKKGASP